MPTEAENLIERARSLVPLLEEHAAEAERLRKPHDAVIEALCEAEIFKLMVPRERGGFGLDIDTFLEVGLTLAEGDGSMSWVSTFYIEHCWMLSHFDEAFQMQVFADRGYALAPAAIAVAGMAEPVPGGFRLNGRWSWGTGAMHAQWVLVGARVDNPDNPADFRFFALPPEDVTIEDVWFVDGMLGTGSNDMVVDDVVVPEDRTASMADLSVGKGLGAKLYDGPLYRTPMLPILGLAASMPAVGQARAAVARFRDSISQRVMYGSAAKQLDKPAAHIRLGRAEIEARQAENLLRESVTEMMELREQASPETRTRWMANYAYAVHQSKRVLADIADASGASAHFSNHPLQRAVRDVNTMSSHIVFDIDSRLETHGRVLLGLDIDSPLV